ncbi:MAG TPA: hypothetical protein VGE01_13185 [Fimbriimonas sp.]
MDESVKKALLSIVAVLAVAVAGFSAYRFMTADKLQAGVQHRSPPKSLKQIEMERMAKEDAALRAGASAAADR